MKYIVGVLCIIAGIILGVYVGLFVLFIGGIVDIVDGVKATPTDGYQIAWGLVKSLMLAEFVGWVIFLFFGLVGVLCFGWERSTDSRSRRNLVPPRGTTRYR